MTDQRKLRRHRRRTSIGGQFAPRLIEMLESPAFRVLSLSARRALDRVEIELAHHGGIDNGRLPVTFADFEQYGMDRHAIAPALREAQALGFLQITERGRAGNAEFRAPNMFRLTYRDTQHADPTHEWRHIRTIEDAQTIAKRARDTQTSMKRRPTQKRDPNGQKYQLSGGKILTENLKRPVGETRTTVVVGKTTTTLDISGETPADHRSPMACTTTKAEDTA